ncbi:hypothetical protein TNCV_874071 [Trichonephila clavipes]|nr:hypothetical protein TNCV_874071 [Trichonephila clavipes]
MVSARHPSFPPIDLGRLDDEEASPGGEAFTRNSKFSYEELLTLIAQIEAILNSRPLTLLSSEVDDLEVLTPAHFLTDRNYSRIVSDGKAGRDVDACVHCLPFVCEIRKKLNDCRQSLTRSHYLSSLLNNLRAFGDGPVAGLPNHGWHVSSSSPVPLKIRRVGQRCTLNLSRAEMSSRCVRALVPQKFSVEEELMHVKHVEVKIPHVGVMWKFGRGVISSGATKYPTGAHRSKHRKGKKGLKAMKDYNTNIHAISGTPSQARHHHNQRH